jgi:Na+/H+ antiporter NhaD/arsenite permease-like protein
VDPVVIAVFAGVYLAMVLGRLPGLALDRTGVALLGAIALVAARRISPQDAWTAIDVPTMALLFGLMVVSAQLRLGGFYSEVARRVASAPVGPARLLAGVIALAATLSAVLANDVVCLAVTPVLAVGCLRRGLRPEPYLLALACAANVGSAATLIGNPQNMLIGQRLGLGFAAYLADALPPAVAGCAVTWAIIALLYRGRWHCPPVELEAGAPAFNRWQSSKGLVVVAVVVAVFLLAPVPREVVALAAAGVLLLSRSMHSRDMLGLVDWQLLVLFIGLFIVQLGLESSGVLAGWMAGAAAWGVDLDRPAWLFAAAVVLSNIVSNVPAVMLLLPAAHYPQAGPLLALASTLAGNLLLVGSIANLIVVEQAARLGIAIGWREHARVGVPVTVATLAIAAAWLALRA